MKIGPEALDDIYDEDAAILTPPTDETAHVIDLFKEIETALQDQPLDDDPRAEAVLRGTLEEFESVGKAAVASLVELRASSLYSGQTSDGRVIPLEDEFPDPDLLFSEVIRQEAYKALRSSEPAPEALMRKLDAIILANDSCQAHFFVDALSAHNNAITAPQKQPEEAVDISQFDNVIRIY